MRAGTARVRTTGTTVRNTTSRSPLEAHVDAGQRDQASAEQPGAHHQRHRQADLGDDERLAGQPPRTPSADPLPPWRRPSAEIDARRRARPARARRAHSPTSDTASAKASAGRSTVTSSRRGRLAGASASSAVTPQRAMSTPPRRR